MTARLPRDVVAHHLARLRPTLTKLQAARLESVLEVLSDDSRFLLSDALNAVELTHDARGQEAFRDFREKVNAAAAKAGVDITLELDSRKAAPGERYGWFRGGDLVDEGIASFAGEAAARTGIDHPVAPEVAELHSTPRIRVYASFHPTTGDTPRRVDALLERLLAELAGPRRTAESGQSEHDLRSVPIGEEHRGDPRPAQRTSRHPARAAHLHLPHLRAPSDRDAPSTPPGRSSPPPSPTCPTIPSLLRPTSPRRHRSGPANHGDTLAAARQRANYVADVAKAMRRALRPTRSTVKPPRPTNGSAPTPNASPGESSTSCSSRTNAVPRPHCARRSSTGRRPGRLSRRWAGSSAG